MCVCACAHCVFASCIHVAACESGTCKSSIVIVCSLTFCESSFPDQRWSINRLSFCGGRALHRSRSKACVNTHYIDQATIYMIPHVPNSRSSSWRVLAPLKSVQSWEKLSSTPLRTSVNSAGHSPDTCNFQSRTNQKGGKGHRLVQSGCKEVAANQLERFFLVFGSGGPWNLLQN